MSSSRVLIAAAGLGALSLWACASAQPTATAVAPPAPVAPANTPVASPVAAPVAAPAPPMQPVAPAATAAAGSGRTGPQILEESCAACHDLGVITASPHTAEDWPVVLQRMVGYGANLSDFDMKKLEAYLIATHTAPH